MSDILKKHPTPWRCDPHHIRPNTGGPTGQFDCWRFFDGNGARIDVEDFSLDQSMGRLIVEAVNSYALQCLNPVDADWHLEADEMKI